MPRRDKREVADRERQREKICPADRINNCLGCPPDVPPAPFFRILPGPMSPRPPLTAVVNGAFRSQRVTGQQRYATQIADRLIALGVREISPGRFWNASSLRVWLWTIAVLPIRARGAVLISLTSRAPVGHPAHVITIHDLFVLTNSYWYARSYRLAHVPLLRLQMRTARAAVVVSGPVADQLCAWPSAHHLPLVVAPNAPSPVFATAVRRNSLAQFDLKNQRFLLTVGTHDPRKNFARLARAWSAVPAAARTNCPLVVVGGTEASFARTAIAWPSGTVIAGYVTDEDLAVLYSSAEALVLVSLAEGFGLPIVEAAAAGVRRFLLSDIEVFKWIAGDGPIYVNPESVSDISDALLLIATGQQDTPESIEMTIFNWDVSARAVLDLALTVTARSPGLSARLPKSRRLR